MANVPGALLVAISSPYSRRGVSFAERYLVSRNHTLNRRALAFVGAAPGANAAEGGLPAVARVRADGVEVPAAVSAGDQIAEAAGQLRYQGIARLESRMPGRTG